MKLLATSSLALLSKLASSTSTGYSSKCTDDGHVEITIPYSNEVTSELLSAVAPGCTVRGPSSDKHTYNFDSDNNQAVLRLNIDGCGLGAIYHESVLRSGDYFMAAANVTIGAHDDDNDRDLIFYNAYLGAECGSKTDYTVKFDYAQRIQKHDQEGCDEHTPDGQCIVAAYETYNFVFREYVGDHFEILVGDGVVHTANQMIHLQIEAMDLPANKKFAVKKCDFVDTITNDDDSTTIERYTMFNAAQGSCSNQYIDLELGYDFYGSQTDNQMASQISHRLFLLTRGDQDSYDLECDIKVCDKDDLSSDCNEWSACSARNAGFYMCEGVTCEADHQCVIDDRRTSPICYPVNACRGTDDSDIMARSLFSNARFTSGTQGYMYGNNELIPSKAIDGDYQTDISMAHPFVNADEFFVDVNDVVGIREIAIYPRTDCCWDRYGDMSVKLNGGAIVCSPSQTYDQSTVENLKNNGRPLLFNCEQDPAFSDALIVRDITVSTLVDGALVHVLAIAEVEVRCA